MFHFRDTPTDVGDVVMTNEGGALSVVVSGQDEWTLGSAKLHVGDVDLATDTLSGFPVTGAGNPKLGKFDYFGEVAGGEVEFLIDPAALAAADTNGDGIVAIAITGGFDSDSELLNGWADCEVDVDFPGGSAAQAIIVDLSDLDIML